MSNLPLAVVCFGVAVLASSPLDAPNPGCVPDEAVQKLARRIDYRYRGVPGDYRQRSIMVEIGAIHASGQRLCSEPENP